MDVALFPVGDLLGGGLFVDGAGAAEVMTRHGAWVRDNARETSTSLLLARFPDLDSVPPPLRGRPAVGPPRRRHRGARRLARMRTAAPILLDTVRMMPYADTATIHNGPTGPYQVFESGFFTGALRPRDIKALLTASPDGHRGPPLRRRVRRPAREAPS